jgi:alpha-glucosidase
MSMKWWQKAVFYQIYPRSFADGNGDGIGDFMGMISKLDYLQNLGIDAVWLSPHFPSPNWDCGYDVSDYCDVAPEYGNLDEFKVFLQEAHKRNIRVILDMVLNHTSDEHPWFIESSSNCNNSKADWYIWKDSPPNNWQSCFDGEAWTYSRERDQYYYHYFMKQQPDLNWHNPEVQYAMWDCVRFWLDIGVDGFRLDAIGTIFENPDLTSHSAPVNLAQLRRLSETAVTSGERKKVGKYWREMFKHQLGQPGVHDLLKTLRSILDEYPGDRVLVGEDDDTTYMGNGEDELHMVFNFPLMATEPPLSPAWIRKNQKNRLNALKKISPTAWPCNTLGNHDRSRVYTQFGDRNNDDKLAGLSIALMLTLKGTPFLYYGEEIGMTDYHIQDPSQIRDTMTAWYYQSLINEFKIDKSEAITRAAEMSRDKNRTPMQWSVSPNAGFCPEDVSPWLPINPNFSNGVNVEAQADDPKSIYSLYVNLLEVRKNSPALMTGDYLAIHASETGYYAFMRACEQQKVLVLLNYHDQVSLVKLSKKFGKAARCLFSNQPISIDIVDPGRITLPAFGIMILELDR